ncbi:FitA-like ribbon-helix-helix domain-containing protein [Sphingomonas sp.]|uniref:FitA-like ribbon-helix-helix domain-containing protein n=1 Tax=Sphingomonas sp. TaxID=28214 RepID=UPI002DD66518|nr:hypothetical protein [Sphingomonas sp.]
MGQMLIRNLDEVTLARLKVAARARKTSAEALAREAVARTVQLTAEEKLELVRQMQAVTERAKVPGVRQTPVVDLIREDRDR